MKNKMKITKISGKTFNSFIVVIILITLFIQSTIEDSFFWYGIVLPLISSVAVYLIISQRKTPKQEIATFFIFPIFMSIILQGILYYVLSDGQTTTILSSIVFIPLSNIAYTAYILRKNELTHKQFSHMVTSIQAMLFISTIISFLVKNPLLFEGYFLKTPVETLGIIGTRFSKLSLSSIIEAVVQTTFLPYLFSATIVKGWIEYKNFIETYEN